MQIRQFVYRRYNIHIVCFWWKLQILLNTYLLWLSFVYTTEIHLWTLVHLWIIFYIHMQQEIFLCAFKNIFCTESHLYIYYIFYNIICESFGVPLDILRLLWPHALAAPSLGFHGGRLPHSTNKVITWSWGMLSMRGEEETNRVAGEPRSP